MRRSRRSLLSRRRNFIQGLSTVLLNCYVLRGAGGFCAPVLNCWACPAANTSCPIGGLQYASGQARLSLAGGASLLSVIPYYLLGTLLLFSATLGRFMCGWLCPFGWLQDLVGRLQHYKLHLPAWTGHLRYVFLIGLVLVVPFYTTQPWFSKLCPQGALEGGLLQPLVDPGLRPLMGTLWYLKEAMLALWLVAFAFIRRPFCRLMCPLGAIFSLFYGISLLQITQNPYQCTDCGWCQRACPAGLDPRKQAGSHLCISCLECQDCPSGAVWAEPIWRKRGGLPPPAPSPGRRGGVEAPPGTPGEPKGV